MERNIVIIEIDTDITTLTFAEKEIVYVKI